MNEIIYTNHQGRSVVFGKGVLHYFENELRDYSWDFTERNGKITAFNKPIQEKLFPVGIAADSEEEGLRIRDELYEIFDIDVMNNTPGTLSVNGWELRCFIKDSKAGMYWMDDRFAEFELTIVAENPMWVKHWVFLIRPEEQGSGTIIHAQGEDCLNYPCDYRSKNGDSIGFDYMTETRNNKLDNPSVTPNNFILRVYGPTNNPKVNIAGNNYQVLVNVPNGSRLEIDSERKTIVLIDSLGVETNCYDARLVGRKGSGSYIFEKIPGGLIPIWVNGGGWVDVEVIEKRSVPAWTQ